MLKNLPAMWRPRFDPWLGKIPWRRKRHPHSRILAWEIPWTVEPGGLQSKDAELDTTDCHSLSLDSKSTHVGANGKISSLFMAE